MRASYPRRLGGGQVTCADIPEPFVGPSPSAVWRSVISAIDGPASPKLATLSGVTYFGLSHPTVRLARRAQRGLLYSGMGCAALRRSATAVLRTVVGV